MPAFSATSPGKIILFGEHAVVYGEPAIAAPLSSARARAIVSARIQGKSGEIWIEAPDIGLATALHNLTSDHPLRAAVQAVIGAPELDHIPACSIQITSEIPPASGLGSSAAISSALIRAFSAFLGKRLSDEQVSELVFEVEKIQHGTPSGIDNTVIAYQKPVFFQMGNPIEFLNIGKDFTVLAAYCGISGNTKEAVAGVRARSERDPDLYNQTFSRIGAITRSAKGIIETGTPDQLGVLMDENHELLQKIGVSTPELDRLVLAARAAGALGAKLSGGGLGGHIIALVKSDAEGIRRELLGQGAVSALITQIQKRGNQ
jgi:mevalonate kinase